VPVVAEGAPGRPGEPRYQPGEPGAGDPYFPLAGNGGIDVVHYDLDLDYTPPAPSPAPLEGQLEGVATIDLVATEDLDRFNLDLRGRQRQVHVLHAGGERARHHATAEAEGRRRGHRGGDLRRHHHATQGHRGRALRVGHHPRRRDGGQ